MQTNPESPEPPTPAGKSTVAVLNELVHGKGSWLIWAAIFLAAPLLYRCISLVQLEVSLTPSDFLGALSDMALSLLFFGTAALLKNRPRIFASVFFGLGLCAVSHSNYEHIRALGTSFDVFSLKFLGDATFVAGSFQVSSPWLALGATAPVLFVVWMYRGVPIRRRYPAAALVLSFLLFLTSSLLPTRSDISTWRQYNVIQQNLLGLMHLAFAKGGSGSIVAKEENTYLPPKGLSAETIHQVEQLLRADLSGQPIVELQNNQHNVLLIMLEAVSGAYLEATSQEFNRSPNYQMPGLSQLAQSGIVFQNYVAHNRRTNRGEYALLCGDYPNLAIKKSKMDYFATEQGAKRLCLAEVLLKAGYQTVYLQSAPLGFMSKDRFMKAAGFDQVLGMAWFERAGAWSAWGPDDRAYFQQSLRKLQQLHQSKRPWFLTMLNSGTHHPYHTDPKWQGSHKKGTLANALEYLDLAVTEFLQRAQEMGALDNTLVLITADESNGFRKRQDLGRQLSQNWIPLLVLQPERRQQPQIITERFMQADLALSVVDFLGLAEPAQGFVGRSFFRSYEKPRPILFGNVYRNKVGMFKPDNSVMLCSNLLADCSLYQPSGIELVAPKYEPAQSQNQDIQFVQQFLSMNELAAGGELKDYYSLARLGPTELRSQNSRYVVFGYQYLNIPSGSDLLVQVTVSVSEGSVLLLQDLFSRGGRTKHSSTQKLEITAGNRLVVDYTYHTAKRMDKTEVRLFAENRSGKPATFSVDRADLYIKTQQRGISGIVDRSVEIVPTNQ